MNAAGEFIPPMLILKRVRMNDCLKKGAPPGMDNVTTFCSMVGTFHQVHKVGEE